MGVVMPGVCDGWPVDWDTAAGGCGDTSSLASLSTDEKQAFIDAAVAWLWRRTGSRYSVCSASVTTVWQCSCRRRSTCQCGRLSLAPLTPVVDVTAVTVDSVALVEGTDFVVSGSDLVRLPACTGWSSGAVMTVAWLYGETPPADLVAAAGVLAVNDALRCAGAACEFPARTRSISAEGMTLDVDNPDVWTVEGRTGIPRVDRVLAGWPWPPRTVAGGCDPAMSGGWADRL